MIGTFRLRQGFGGTGTKPVDRSGGGWLRTAKSCGPGAPGLAPSLEMILKATVTKKVMDTGESAKQPLTPSRREGRHFPVNLW